MLRRSGIRPLPGLVFQSPGELDALLDPQLRRRHGRHALLLLRIPGLAPGLARRWEASLNARFNACGCSLGAACGLTGLLASTAWQFQHDGFALAHWPGFALRSLVALFALTPVGKLLGQGLARLDLRRLVRSIQARAPTTPGARARTDAGMYAGADRLRIDGRLGRVGDVDLHAVG